jgi:hypothetical protein
MTNQNDLLCHFTLGSLLGVIEMLEKGLATQGYVLDRIREIRREYLASVGIAVEADRVRYAKELA